MKQVNFVSNLWIVCLAIIYTVFQKKTPTHIIGYMLRSSCLILIIFDTNIPHIIWHHMTAIVVHLT